MEETTDDKTAAKRKKGSTVATVEHHDDYEHETFEDDGGEMDAAAGGTTEVSHTRRKSKKNRRSKSKTTFDGSVDDPFADTFTKKKDFKKFANQRLAKHSDTPVVGGEGGGNTALKNQSKTRNASSGGVGCNYEGLNSPQASEEYDRLVPTLDFSGGDQRYSSSSMAAAASSGATGSTSLPVVSPRTESGRGDAPPLSGRTPRSGSVSGYESTPSLPKLTPRTASQRHMDGHTGSTNASFSSTVCHLEGSSSGAAYNNSISGKGDALAEVGAGARSSERLPPVTCQKGTPRVWHENGTQSGPPTSNGGRAHQLDL